MQYTVQELIKLAKTYRDNVNTTDTALSYRIGGNGKFLGRLLAAGDMRSGPCERASIWFDENWPPGVAWPRDVPRARDKAQEAVAQETAEEIATAAKALRALEERLGDLADFTGELARLRTDLGRIQLDDRLGGIETVTAELQALLVGLRPATLQRITTSGVYREMRRSVAAGRGSRRLATVE